MSVEIEQLQTEIDRQRWKLLCDLERIEYLIQRKENREAHIGRMIERKMKMGSLVQETMTRGSYSADDLPDGEQYFSI